MLKRRDLFPNLLDRKGQAMFETMLFIPMLLMIVALMWRSNSAVQVSIVNQQYARAHALFLTFNSPYYPELKFKSPALSQDDLFMNNNYNQMLIGISEDSIPEGAAVQAAAPTYSIVAKSATVKGDESAKAMPSKRSTIRVRSTVSLCAPLYYISGSGSKQLAHIGLMDSMTWPYSTVCQAKFPMEQ
jgi:hypothetical protein